jgi:hypothetical protein
MVFRSGGDIRPAPEGSRLSSCSRFRDRRPTAIATVVPFTSAPQRWLNDGCGLDRRRKAFGCGVGERIARARRARSEG